jgi:ribosomal protein S18 acetylase RimI-like enzyme
VSGLLLRPAASPEDVETARALFREYETSIGISLCFQNFEEEVAALPGDYAPPAGRLLLAFAGAEPAGCAAFRKIGEGIAEMKRLFVRSAFRGHGLGRTLTETLLADAKAAGYRAVRLDTLSTMTEAQALYLSLGFTDIPPYNDHPVAGTRFLEKTLSGGSP